MNIMGKGGEKVHTRELKRMFLTEQKPKTKKTENEPERSKIKSEDVEIDDDSIVVDDYWIVRELDDKNDVLYEKCFEIDDWVKAMNHFETRSEIPVIWEEDEERDLSKRYQWTMYPK